MLAKESCWGSGGLSYEFPSSFNAIALAAMVGKDGLGDTGFESFAFFFSGCGFGNGQMG